MNEKSVTKITDCLSGAWLISGILAVVFSIAYPDKTALNLSNGGIMMSEAHKLPNTLWLNATGKKEVIKIDREMIVLNHETYVSDVEKAIKQGKQVIIFCSTGCGYSKKIRAELSARFPSSTIYYLIEGDSAITTFKYEK